jgi:hypothetical protein
MSNQRDNIEMETIRNKIKRLDLHDNMILVEREFFFFEIIDMFVYIDKSQMPIDFPLSRKHGKLYNESK